jgi:Zn-finger nucleic acid-binding protein
MADRSGIEIDFCPTCRGVWLDRGELDKIIERSAAFTTGGPAPAAQPAPIPSYQQPAPPRRDYDDDDDDYKRRQYSGDNNYGQKKKSKSKSMLGELFDF